MTDTILTVCVDCYFYAVGGYENRTSYEHLSDVEWKALTGAWRACQCADAFYDPEADMRGIDPLEYEPEFWFSWDPCQGCGSTLGGDRVKVAAEFRGE